MRRNIVIAGILVALLAVGTLAEAQTVRLSKPFTGLCDSGKGGSRSWQASWSAYPSTGTIYITQNARFSGIPLTWSSAWAEASVYKRWTPPYTGKVKVTAVISIYDGFEELYCRPGAAWFTSTIRVGKRGNLARSTFAEKTIEVASWQAIIGRYYKDYGGQVLKGTTYLDVRKGYPVDIAAGLNTVGGAYCPGFDYSITNYGATVQYIELTRVL